MAANAFWGGFADTLKGRLDQENELELDMQREQRLQELKKKYEAEIIDSALTKVEGNEEIRYNKFGTEISRRPLGPEEIAMRQATVDKTTADARRSAAEAGMSEYEYGNREADRQLSLDDAASIRRAREASTAQGWSRIELDKRRLDEDTTREERLDQEGVTTTLFEAGDLGDVSAMSLLAEYDRELNAATTKEEKRRVIAKYQGLARNRLMEAKQKIQSQYGRGSDPSFGGMPPALPPPQ